MLFKNSVYSTLFYDNNDNVYEYALFLGLGDGDLESSEYIIKRMLDRYPRVSREFVRVWFVCNHKYGTEIF